MTAKPQRYRGGRRTKFTQAIVNRLMTAVRSGLPFGLACRKAGLGESTVHGWRQTKPGFDDEIQAAQLAAIDARVKIIEGAAKMGDWRAAAFLLQTCHPEHFSKNRVEHEHRHVGVSFTIPASTLDEISKARRDYERKVIDVQTDQTPD